MKTDSYTTAPYLLLTPGPLTTTRTVKQVMMEDWCTWDTDYNRIVQQIRNELVSIATVDAGYTSVLMQGSGTFGVEAVITTVIPENGKLLVLANGAYGQRIAAIAGQAGISLAVDDSGETQPPDIDRLVDILKADVDITHVALVHCETTTGILNPVSAIGETVKAFDKTFIVDAMSSFGGIPLDMGEIQADYLISSANKCIQGVPGFSFVVAKKSAVEKTRGQARSLSLDLYDQWKTMEKQGGKWRFTSPTHVVRAFAQALRELEDEGGVVARNQRYCKNQKALVHGMRDLGFQTLVREEWQSPIITAFHYPDYTAFSFNRFYGLLKNRGFVIYPGKVTGADTFRIGTIGNVYPDDIKRLLQAVETSMFWR
jgi:2-aminoethylphosphonate-pyruvate transaminase